MIYLTKALSSLGVDEFYIEFDGTPSTEEEMNQAFHKLNADGEFVQGLSNIDVTWSQIQAKAAELEAQEPINQLRIERNKRLQETDWWELPSQAPMSEERTAYRQALRDITNTYNSLDTVQWPTKPV